MANDGTSWFAEPLARAHPRLGVPLDFGATDTETTPARVRLLTVSAQHFNVIAVVEFGGRGGPVRKQGSVLADELQRLWTGLAPHA
jgi:hypothetical protein